MQLKELMEKRMALISQAREIDNKVTAEKREYLAEETEQFERIMAEAEGLVEQIKTAEAAEKRSQFLTQSEQWANASTGRKVVDEVRTAHDQTKEKFAMASFRKYLRFGANGLNHVEMRALVSDDASAGGYLNPPTVFNQELIQSLNDAVFIRGLARKFPFTGSNSLTFPKKTVRVSAPVWTTEIGDVDEDESLAFGSVTLTPQQLSKLVKVSLKMLNVSTFPVEQFVREELTTMFAETLEYAYLYGRGPADHLEPIGVFEGSATGALPDTRNVAVGDDEEYVTTEGLMNAKFHMRVPYWNGARWLFSPSVVKQICLLRDKEGRFLWQPSLVSGQPDMLLGLPVDMSAFAPAFNNDVPGTYCGALVNWSKGYYVADLQSLEIQRCVEKYADTSEVGLIGRMYTDGKPVDDGAFVRLTLGAAIPGGGD